MNRWLPLVPLLLALAGCDSSPPPAVKKTGEEAIPVTVGKVEVVPLDRTVPVIGTLFSKDDATVSAEVEGRVEKTFAEMGDNVKADQPLVAIDTDAYDAQARRSAANLAKAQASAENAELNLRREEELKKDGVAATSALDLAQAEAKQWRAEVKSVAASDLIARLNLERSTVKAPFDAAVVDRLASAGDFVRIGTPLYRIVNDRVLKFITQIPERHAAEVQKEQPVALTVDAYPGTTFEGAVYLISPSVNTATRAFPVGALVPNPERKLKANTFARGELILARQVPTTVVPLDAVVLFAGVAKVFVVENGVARSRQVQTKRIVGARQEILEGLKVGETVVVSGQTKLYDGAKARVKEQPGAVK